MKKKIATLTLCAAMTASLCSCVIIKQALGLYRCFLPSDDFAAFNGENYYYISEGVLYEDGEKFFDDKIVAQVFANSSYVFAASENDVTVLDFDGEEQQVFEIGNVSDICGDDEYVFFKYVNDGTVLGNLCDYYDVAANELHSVNELINEQCNSGNYCKIAGDMSSAYGYASYVDIGPHRIFALVYNANIKASDYGQFIYLCGEISTEFASYLGVDNNGTIYFSDMDIMGTVSITSDLRVSKTEFEKNYSDNTVVYAQYPEDNIIIAEQNDGYYDTSYEPLEDWHISSSMLKLNEESATYEEVFQTDETAQIVGYHNGKALVVDYEDRKVYSDDTNGNIENICTFEKGEDKYIYFEIVGDKLFVFGSQSNYNPEVKMLYSSDLD